MKCNANGILQNLWENSVLKYIMREGYTNLYIILTLMNAKSRNYVVHTCMNKETLILAVKAEPRNLPFSTPRFWIISRSLISCLQPNNTVY